MAQHEYKCQSCFHRGVCPEYHPETYSCVHHLDEADVAPRAEVADEVFKEVLKKLFEMQKRYEQVRHRGKAEQMMVARCEIYKLQKKYKEEK